MPTLSETLRGFPVFLPVSSEAGHNFQEIRKLCFLFMISFLLRFWASPLWAGAQGVLEKVSLKRKSREGAHKDSLHVTP